MGSAGRIAPVEIVIDDNGRVIFGKCACDFFQENLLGRGPCEHMIALYRASEPRRRDMPSSFAAAADAASPPNRVRSEEDDAEGEESDVDEDEEENEK